ncbi:MAG: MBL fold metallo-hydrolase [Chloroflexi bacterium]|nr:MBL fold metallo-hydrolase [Chloroflexota bacterium]
MQFFERPFPSGNVTLIRGRRPILIDTGFGSDLPSLERLLRDAGTSPEELALVVNTHYHADHVGGNYGLQTRYGVQIAAHRWEAELVNRRDPEACSVAWLNQSVEPYHVDRMLSEGDEIDAGGVRLQVLHIPGHTLGHVALYAPDDQVLISGDAVFKNDVSWVNPFREGVGALRRTIEALERLGELPARIVCPGHGPPIQDLPGAVAVSIRRYEKWLANPVLLAWHAGKRIFAYGLMVTNGRDEEEVASYLLSCPWFQDYCWSYFEQDPSAFVEPFLAEMRSSGVATWRDGRVAAVTTFDPPPPNWLTGPDKPSNWPPADLSPEISKCS